MALDGAFLRHIKQEITDQALGARVDKIYQPNRDELVLSLRTRHELLAAGQAGVTLVDAGHFKTETIVVGPLACRLRERFPQVEFVESQACTDGVHFL